MASESSARAFPIFKPSIHSRFETMPHDFPEVIRTYAVLGQVNLADLRGLPDAEVQDAISECLVGDQSALFKPQLCGLASEYDIVHFSSYWKYGAPGASAFVFPPDEPWYRASVSVVPRLFTSPVYSEEEGTVGDVSALEAVLLKQDLRRQIMDLPFHSISGLVEYNYGLFVPSAIENLA
jgi:hypothetical protein